MMKNMIFNRFISRSVLILILTVSFLAMAAEQGQIAANESGKYVSLSEFSNDLEKRIPSLMEEYDVPGVAIALIKRGKVVWSNACGYADLETGRRMTTDTYCRVESISKSVTAWGVMKMVESGKVDLDRPVMTYLKRWKFPESEYPTEKITVRHLLSHSSGMPLGTIGVRYSPEGEIPSLKESLSGDAVLEREPGLSFSYSNTGFNLLELLIEEVTGLDFAEYMAQEVLIPLGMYRSSFTWSKEFDPEVPFGYDLNGKPVPVYVYPDKGSGGLFASVEDIAIFVSAGMTDFTNIGYAVLSEESINKLYTPVVRIPGLYGLAFDSYGLGHFIETLSDGRKAVSHGGQGSGWMTHFHSIPETGDGIVILTNSQRSWLLIANILRDWARWNAFPSVGMEMIIRGRRLVWILIALLFFVSMGQICRLAKGFVTGKRSFSPLSKESRIMRSVQGGFFIILAACLFMAINQDYLFISSLYPIASVWLGFAIFLCAVVLLFSALLPNTEKKSVNAG